MNHFKISNLYRYTLPTLMAAMVILSGCKKESTTTSYEAETVPVKVSMRMRPATDPNSESGDNLFNRLWLIATDPNGAIADMQYYSNIGTAINTYDATMMLKVYPVDHMRTIHALAFRIETANENDAIFTINKGGVESQVKDINGELYLIRGGNQRKLNIDDLNAADLTGVWNKTLVINPTNPTETHNILFSGQSEETTILLENGGTTQEINIPVYRAVSRIEAYIYKDKPKTEVKIKNIRIGGIRKSSLLAWDKTTTDWESLTNYPLLMPSDLTNNQKVEHIVPFTTPVTINKVVPTNWQNAPLDPADRLAYAYSAPIVIQTLQNNSVTDLDEYPFIEITLDLFDGHERVIRARIGEKTSDSPIKYEGNLKPNKIYRVIAEVKESTSVINIQIKDWTDQEINQPW